VSIEEISISPLPVALNSIPSFEIEEKLGSMKIG
jgi:hypothetical protein